MRKESESPEKISEIHKNYFIKLIADSPLNTLNKIVLKLMNNNESEVHRKTILRFLVEMIINEIDQKLFSEIMSRIKRIGLNSI